MASQRRSSLRCELLKDTIIITALQLVTIYQIFPTCTTETSPGLIVSYSDECYIHTPGNMVADASYSEEQQLCP